MALLVRTRPIFGPLLRSLLSNTTRTFTGRTQVVCPLRPEISIRHQSGFDIVKSSQHQPTLLSSIRLASSGGPIEARPPDGKTTSDVRKVIPYVASATYTLQPIVNQEIETPIITGAILPFAQLNYLQQLVFPYTYALMYYLDYLAGIMPWWAAIITTTATARLLFFPLVVKQNSIGIKVNNVLPETQKIQKQLNEALCSGDVYNQAIARTKLSNLYKEHDITLKQRLIPVLIQAPLYMSFFFLLRKLTTIPVEGLTTGGVLWFTDLTAADPFYILPLITSTTMFLLLEFGLEGSTNPALMTPGMRYFMRALPVVIFAFTYSFPAATLLFWSTSNFFTLSYALIMKTALFKKMFNVPSRRKIDKSELILSNASFNSQVKTAIDRTNASKTSFDVRRLDDIAFRKAGIGPLRKTYKNPPKTADQG